MQYDDNAPGLALGGSLRVVGLDHLLRLLADDAVEHVHDIVDRLQLVLDLQL